MDLRELAEELERQRDAKEDRLVPPDQIHFVSGADSRSEIDLHSAGVTELRVTDNAHIQIAERLKIPVRYYNFLREEKPDLLDENVNRLLHHGERGKWMVRTLDHSARAVLSDQYRRIDNADIAEVVFPIFTDTPGVRVRSAHVGENHMYIKATTPRVQGEVIVGEPVCAGVIVQNSEVGAGKVVVRRFVETLECENGMVISRRGEGMEQIHLGQHLQSDDRGRIVSSETRVSRDRAFLMLVRDAVRTAIDEQRFADLVADMSRAAADEPVQDARAAVDALAARESLTEDEGRGILQYLADGGDLSRWGMISAVTRVAEDAETYDRATELEVLGGKVLDYGPRQWNDLAHVKGEVVEPATLLTQSS